MTEANRSKRNSLYPQVGRIRSELWSHDEIRILSDDFQYYPILSWCYFFDGQDDSDTDLEQHQEVTPQSSLEWEVEIPQTWDCFSKSQDVFRMQKGSEQRHISFQLRNVNSEQISLKILVVWSWINIMNTLALLIDMKQNFTCFFDSFFHSFSCCSDQSPLLVR